MRNSRKNEHQLDRIVQSNLTGLIKILKYNNSQFTEIKKRIFLFQNKSCKIIIADGNKEFYTISILMEPIISSLECQGTKLFQ